MGKEPPVNCRAAAAPRNAPAWLAMGLCLCAVSLLGLRTLTSTDLGYHLLYGAHTLRTGEPVSHNGFLFTLPAPDAPPAERPAPGPGCWYDEAGRYRFPNANWLSQVLLAAANTDAAGVGLCVLRLALTVAVFALSTAILIRLGAGPLLAGAGLLMAGLAAYPRLNLRPELIAYVLLLAQLRLLLARRLGAGHVVCLVALQLLLVNSHSYFLLGPALTGAFAADRAVRAVFSRGEGRAEHLRTGRLLAATLLLQAGACLLNPWTWRIALLPLQTLRFLRSPAGEPWRRIGELFGPFDSEAFFHMTATYFYVLVLAVGGMGAVAAVHRRKWALLLVLLGMGAASLSVRRNIGLGAIFLVPIALPLLKDSALALGAHRFGLWRRGWVRPAACGALVLVSAGLAASVISNRFYASDRLAQRFGFGWALLVTPPIPTGLAGDYSRSPAPPPAVWVGFQSSSNFAWMREGGADGRPVRLPLLTNTWAVPPRTMGAVLDINEGKAPWRPAFEANNVQEALLRLDNASAPLARRLLADPHWRLVRVRGMYAEFLPEQIAEDRNRPAMTEQNFNVELYCDQLLAMDPVAPYALFVGGVALRQLEWHTPAIDVLGRSVAADGGDPVAWNELGLCHARRGIGRYHSRQAGWRPDLLEARKCFRQALAQDTDYAPAALNLRQVEKDLNTLR